MLGFVPAIILSALSAFGTEFMSVGFVLEIVSAAIAVLLFWRWQTAGITKTITDYPRPGESRTHKAEWKGQNFDRLLSRHVAFCAGG